MKGKYDFRFRIYHTRSDEWISYTNYVYFSIDNIYNAVEKDENETKVLLNNGKTVYVFGNLDTQDIMWTEGQSEFNLSGNIENETVPNSV